MDNEQPLRIERILHPRRKEEVQIGWFRWEEAKVSVWLNGLHIKDGAIYAEQEAAIEEASCQARYFRLSAESEVVILVTSAVYERVRIWREQDALGEWVWPKGESGDLPSPILKAQRAVWSSRTGRIDPCGDEISLRFEHDFSITGSSGQEADLAASFRAELAPVPMSALACGLGFQALEVFDFRVAHLEADPAYPKTRRVRASGQIKLFFQASAFEPCREKGCGLQECYSEHLHIRCLPTSHEAGPRWALRKSVQDSTVWRKVEQPTEPDLAQTVVR